MEKQKTPEIPVTAITYLILVKCQAPVEEFFISFISSSVWTLGTPISDEKAEAQREQGGDLATALQPISGRVMLQSA